MLNEVEKRLAILINVSGGSATSEAEFRRFATMGIKFSISAMTARSDKREDPYPPMNATDKLFAVFSLFTYEKPEWTVDEAAEQLGYPVSTAYRFFKSLSDEGLIVAYAAGRYVLGPAIIQLDRQIRLQDPLIKAGSSIMKRLAAESPFDGTFLLCRLYRNQVICVHQEARGFSDLTVSYERGRLMPLHRGAASKIILAHLPVRPVRAYQATNATDIEAAGLGGDWETMKQSLRRIRKAGICITHAELDNGAIGIAAPLFLLDESVVGSLGLVLLEQDINKQLVPTISQKLMAAAAEITARLRTKTGGSHQAPS
ncbi:IclR family transcriptional regulator [Shinella sumterensis]|uniref:IclR family transcriptional regulator n=1 Tax=Shinella sumterensis TaxID=1967501 RepID=A0AA50H740_9HYPH|nr:IclR family transcriptional regulator [Shinella sumterensis]WLS00680.1 IclR family transcriptional regulator [Shinella sumterensis]